MGADYAILEFINSTCSNPVFDAFFPWWTQVQRTPEFLYFILPALLILIFYTRGVRGFGIVAIAALGSWATDILNSELIKPLFNRPRPFDTTLPFDLILRSSKPASSSFPSGHAMDAFFLASFLAFYFPRAKWIFFFLAFLTAISRPYLGVHFPSDILAGSVIGLLLGTLTARLLNQPMKKLKLVSLCFLAAFLLSPSPASAVEDPTHGKPFFPWLWEDQFKPTITHSFDGIGPSIILGGGALTAVAHQYDADVYNHNFKGQNLIFDSGTAGFFGQIGGGPLGVGIAAVQILFDQRNGLMHGRAIVLTTLSHASLAFLVQRERPGARTDFLPFPSSWPSGHASSAFATAASLGYAYGWVAGVPATLVATAIAAGRVSENAHWFSDVFAGAALGFFWAHASYKAETAPLTAWRIAPTPIEDGLVLSASREF